jgi:flagellar basal body-associated protein FliL
VTVGLGDLGSIAAVAISAIAWWFAVKSTRASERAAISSAVSAEAAQETVRLARAAQQYAERPAFKITVEEQNGTFYVTVRMVEGPPIILVDAEYSATVRRIQSLAL